MILRKEQRIFEAARATEDSLKGGDLEDVCRIWVTNGEEWDMKIVLNIIANDNNSSPENDA